MSYELDITPEAAYDLFKLPLIVAEYVDRQLRAFAAHPAQYSVPSHFSYPIDGQAFRFEFEYGDTNTRYYFHVLFKYGQDEQTLHILIIAHTTSNIREGDWEI